MLFPTLRCSPQIFLRVKLWPQECLQKAESFLSALQELVPWPAAPCAVCFIEGGWVQRRGAESSNVMVRIALLPYTVMLHQSSWCCWQSMPSECVSVGYTHWLNVGIGLPACNQAIDLQPTSHYRGTLPAILTGLQEVRAGHPNFHGMALTTQL